MKRMNFRREKYIKKLKSLEWNGMAKVITGPRRVGKSYLLFTLFKEELIRRGVRLENIIQFSFDSETDPKKLDATFVLGEIVKKLKDSSTKYYVFLDEIQEVHNFIPVMNALLRRNNVDLYVTGSNSHRLSRDVVTKFAGRGWQVPVSPLSLKEIKEAWSQKSNQDIWEYYKAYGGYPSVFNLPTLEEKKQYLTNILQDIYIKDIVRRHRLKSGYVIEDVLKDVASSIGSFTNPLKVSHTFRSKAGTKTSAQTISNYLKYLEDSFLISRVGRVDISGRQFIGALYKYYFEDLGIRNAVLGEGKKDEGHLMENAVYSELVSRGFAVHIGAVLIFKNSMNGEKEKTFLEVDFVAKRGGEVYYIQVSENMSSEEQQRRERRPFEKIKDAFPRILVSKDTGYSYLDELGILHVNFFKFMTDESILENNAIKSDERDFSL